MDKSIGFMKDSEKKPNKRILVIDDDLELCHVIVDTLLEQGYGTSSVMTAEEGFEKAVKDPPDLMLLDMEVPQMGGFVLCQKFRTTPETKSVPIVFLTVRDSEFDKRTAASLGANGYVTKPFRRSHLISEVERLLEAGPIESAGTVLPPVVQSESKAKGAIPMKEGAPVSQSASVSADFITQLGGMVPTIKGSQRTTGSRKKGKDGSAGGKGSGVAGSFSRKKVFMLGIGIVMIIGMMAGTVKIYRSFSQSEKKEALPQQSATVVPVNIIRVQPGPFQDVLSGVGTITGGREVELRFEVEGRIQAIKVREGDSVQKGQLIARLDQSQVMIKYKRAESNFHMDEKLYAMGAISRRKYEDSRLEWDYAKSELRKTELRASHDGIFGDKSVEVGEYISPQIKLGLLVSLDSVFVTLGVIEKDIDKLFPDQTVISIVDTYPDIEFKGVIETISPVITRTGSRTAEVKARIPNDEKLLLPGMFARTKILVYEEENVIVVPNDALEKTPNGYKLFVVGKENKAVEKMVTVSYVSFSHSVISQGIEPGERVIIQKPQELKPGTPLKIMEDSSAGAL